MENGNERETGTTGNGRGNWDGKDQTGTWEGMEVTLDREKILGDILGFHGSFLEVK